MFDMLAEKHNCLVRLLRIHPVQSVVNNITQLSGRGFPHIFHMKLFVSQLYVFWYFKIEAEPCSSAICKFEFRNSEILNVQHAKLHGLTSSLEYQQK